MTWSFWDGLVIIFFLLFLAAGAYAVVTVLGLIRTPMKLVNDRIKPMIGKGKQVAQTGKQEMSDNKERWGSLTGEIKSLVRAIRPPSGDAIQKKPSLAISYRSLLTAWSTLAALRRGWSQLQAARNPASNPPGPTQAKKKAKPRALGALPEIVRLALDVRRELKRR